MPTNPGFYLNSVLQPSVNAPTLQAEAGLASASRAVATESTPPRMSELDDDTNDYTIVTTLIAQMPRAPRALPMTPPQKAALEAERLKQAALAAQGIKANTFMQGVTPSPSISGAKGLSGQAYELEKLDKKHRMGDVLMKFFNVYRQTPTDLEFFDWVDKQTYFTAVRIFAQAGWDNDSIRQFALAFLRGVQYMGRAARSAHRVEITGGKLTRGGEEFDSANNSTIFSGLGWAIWVMSPGGVLYTGNHKKGELQHSGFLDGGSVKCAGEWKVEGGVVKMVSAKSGHYKCDVNALFTTMTNMRGDGLELRLCDVLLGGPSGKTEKIPAVTFLQMSASERMSYRTLIAHGDLPFAKVDAPKPKPKFSGAIGSHRPPSAEQAFNYHRQ